MNDIQKTIDEYAQTVHSKPTNIRLSNYYDNYHHRMLDTVPSQTSFTSSLTQRTNKCGSQAVLCALRALQSKISNMSNEQKELTDNYNTKIIKLETEKSKINEQLHGCSTKLRQMIKLNQKLTQKLKLSSMNETKACNFAESSKEKLLHLQAFRVKAEIKFKQFQQQMRKSQARKTSDQKQKISNKRLLQRNKKLHLDINSVRDQLKYERQLKQSIQKRKEKAEQIITDLIEENETLSNKLLYNKKRRTRSKKYNMRKRRSSSAKRKSAKSAVHQAKRLIARQKTNHRPLYKCTNRQKRPSSHKIKYKPFLPPGKVKCVSYTYIYHHTKTHRIENRFQNWSKNKNNRW